jgi:hypothetical protein
VQTCGTPGIQGYSGALSDDDNLSNRCALCR